MRLRLLHLLEQVMLRDVRAYFHLYLGNLSQEKMSAWLRTTAPQSGPVVKEPLVLTMYQLEQ
jgi:hypothetical protein